MQLFEAILDDGTGSVMLVWFNQPYLAGKIHRHDELAIYGQPRINPFGRLQIENPDYEKIAPGESTDDEGSIVPVYSAIATLQSKVIRGLLAQALPAVADLPDALPEEVRQKLGVLGLRETIIRLHCPSELTDEFLAQKSPAHQRMILQEFFSFQLALRVRRALEEVRLKRRQIRIDEELRETVRRILPFRLTSAQKRVLREIAADMESSRPMYRLLQGDVGSGKTIVALIAAVISIRNGHQAALLAPTEILAEQHFQRVTQLLGASDIRVAKLTGSTPAKNARETLAQLAAGEIDLIIGTHALIEERVKFRSFGLAIVDEQHRFGVAQRQRLFDKGDLPDVLVMTATPIPRSLALAMYGDLELSTIDELPPGRTPIRTVVRGSAQMPKIESFISEQLSEGAQTYVVFPIIEESDKLDLKPLLTGVEEFRRNFPGRRVGMLHGKMTAEEKESTMASFKRGEIDILVTTTVIEVGIDVPNASIMVIIHADRFGFSQLHQLRGRVGRGDRKSFCILVRDEHTAEDVKERLRTFEATTSGFDVAEKDLQMRGAGDFFGTRQSGLPRFRFGDILRDYVLMERAREAAIDVVDREGLDRARAILGALVPDDSLATGRRD